jgi:hypothetical protein
VDLLRLVRPHGCGNTHLKLISVRLALVAPGSWFMSSSSLGYWKEFLVKKRIMSARRQRLLTMLMSATIVLPVAAKTATADIQATPISVTSTSWNADVVYAANSANSDSAKSFDGSYAWDALDAILYGDTNVTSGLGSTSPPTEPYVFSSAAGDNLNTTKTQFEFQSFLSNNADYFSGPGGALTLTTATAYDNIAILAASSNSGQNAVQVNMTLNFANGTSSAPIAYSIYDWGDSHGPTAQWALAKPVDRSTDSSSTAVESTSNLDTANLQDFQMYETDFNLAQLGYSNDAITSISFSAPSGGDVGIFALSGSANPVQPARIQSDPPPSNDPPASPVPTPASLPLAGLGVVLLLLRAARRAFNESLR